MSRDFREITFYAASFGLLGLALGWACGSLLTRNTLQHDERVQQSIVGPWGCLRTADSLVEAPESRFKVVSLPTNATEWFVDVLSPLALRQKLRACDLTEPQTEALVKGATPAAQGTGFLLHPPDDLVIGLGPHERANLYGLLAGYPQNGAQTAPFRFDLNTDLDWFAAAHLDPAVEALVRQLVYRRHNMRLFSDLPLVLRRHAVPQIYARLFRALSREVTVIASVRVLPGDNLKDLADYWGWPDRQEAVYTLLQTAQLSGGAHDVPVALLLPPFARDHLYQYPSPLDPDFSSSHYTCMNFFSGQQPDLRFTNLAEVARSLQQDYLEVPEHEHQLGDVVLLIRKGEGIVHAGNYIADRLVFTKNGGALVRPWLLARLDDLVDFYSYPTPVTVKILRRRDLLRH